MFVVAYETAVEHQDPVRLLHDPPPGLRNEALVARVAFDDLHVDAVVLAVFDDGLLEALSDQALRFSNRTIPAAVFDAGTWYVSCTRRIRGPRAPRMMSHMMSSMPSEPASRM